MVRQAVIIVRVNLQEMNASLMSSEMMKHNCTRVLLHQCHSPKLSSSRSVSVGVSSVCVSLHKLVVYNKN